MEEKHTHSCSFCGIRNNDPECKIMISGPSGNICGQCVIKCVEVLHDKLAEELKP